MARFRTLPQRVKRYRRPGDLVFAAAFLAFALFLLSQLGAQTVWVSGQPLFAQPAFWPAVGTIGMVLFGLLHVIGSLASPRIAGRWREVAMWLRSFEFVGWFLLYVWVVPYAGYLPATLAVAVSLAFRLGYRSPGTLATAALTGFAVVLVFRTFLQVRLPGGQIYHALPEGLSNFMLVNF